MWVPSTCRNLWSIQMSITYYSLPVFYSLSKEGGVSEGEGGNYPIWEMFLMLQWHICVLMLVGSSTWKQVDIQYSCCLYFCSVHFTTLPFKTLWQGFISSHTWFWAHTESLQWPRWKQSSFSTWQVEKCKVLMFGVPLFYSYLLRGLFPHFIFMV